MQDEQKKESTGLSPEIYRQKMIFCALLQKAVDMRNSFFEVDWSEYGISQADRISKDAIKHSSDRKWAARQALALQKQMQEMRADKVKLEGRLNIVIKKTLDSIPKDERKDYQEALNTLEELIKNP